MQKADATGPVGEGPLLAEWAGPFGMPPLDAIAPEHFPPAFAEALARARAEIAAIAGNKAAPTFDNTIAALERSGHDLARVEHLFFVLSGAHTNDALEEIERDIAPVLARHRSDMFLNETLFRRVDDLQRRRDALGLTAEQGRVLERYHVLFVRAGGRLAPAAKKRMAEITERLASLGTSFGQNILADEKSYALVLEGEEDLAGLPDFVRAAASEAAAERGMPQKHVITLSRSSIEPFLEFATRRDLREQAFKAWTARGDNGGATDNKAIAAEMVRLRAERARLLGHPTFAHYQLEDTMAKTPEAVQSLLDDIWTRARARALSDRDALQGIVRKEGGSFALAPWDWRYYAEKLRKARHDIDETQIKPYLPLGQMIDAAFYTANRLFGLTFTPLDDVPRYHPDVRAWEVRGADGRHVGVFLGDYFARESKHSGAWMTALRPQEKLRDDIRPIILNVMNFSKGGEHEPALLSFDDARTLFHEFGHALHGLLSDVTYPLIAGTNVPSDFVEFPSQIYEHWLEEPELLRRFAVHYRTGEPMPAVLLEHLLAARNFNQGFTMVEYAASAIVDLDFHLLPSADNVDVAASERATLTRIGMPAEIVMRHRTPHFAHVFSGSEYAAGYYSYLWSEVLDADGFAAFKEAGDIFDPATARALHDHVYAAGFLREPDEAYRAYRGKMPTIEALLKKRGFDREAATA